MDYMRLTKGLLVAFNERPFICVTRTRFRHQNMTRPVAVARNGSHAALQNVLTAFISGTVNAINGCLAK